MKKRAEWTQWLGMLAMAAWVVAGTAGCEDDDDFDRVPPAGQGSLVVDNNTGDRVRVFIDGGQVQSVGKYDDRYYDLNPGTYRVALDGDDTDRFWIGEIDILQGRVTVLDVTDDVDDYDDFDVDLDYQ